MLRKDELISKVKKKPYMKKYIIFPDNNKKYLHV